MRAAPQDDDAFDIRTNGQRWILSWHTGLEAPAGRRHGAAGICVTDSGEVVLISADGTTWDFPAGRPEGHESWEETLRREMLEEACAVVRKARLLGFSRGRCVEGRERGLVLVRSVWLAQVQLLEWNPQFEIKGRRLVPPRRAIEQVPTAYGPLWTRAFSDAALL